MRRWPDKIKNLVPLAPLPHSVPLFAHSLERLSALSRLHLPELVAQLLTLFRRQQIELPQPFAHTVPLAGCEVSIDPKTLLQPRLVG